MKNSKQILKDIEKKKNELEAVKKEIKEIDDKHKSIENFRDRLELINADMDLYSELCIKENNTKKYLACLNNNYHYVYSNELLIIAIDILKNYAGKQYGPKTRDLIIDDAKKHSFNMYLENNQLVIIPLKNGFSYCLSYHFYIKDILINNKICDLSALAGFDVSGVAASGYTKYIENINKYLKDITKIYNELLNMEKSFQKLQDQYSELRINGFRDFYISFTGLYSDFLN